jgi:methionyl-tRNA formyltransferase
MKKVIIAGKGPLALKIFNWFLEHSDKYKVICFVPVFDNDLYEWANDDLEKLSNKHSIPYVSSGNLEDIPGIMNEIFFCDIMQLCFFKKIITNDIIKKFNIILNIHLSDLPKYRGSRGINWALKNNESEQGVTMHLIDKKLDHGPIISQMKFSIFPYFQEVIDVYYQAIDYAYILFSHTLLDIDNIIPVKQDESKATFYDSRDFSRLGDRLTFKKEKSL